MWEKIKSSVVRGTIMWERLISSVVRGTIMWERLNVEILIGTFLLLLKCQDSHQYVLTIT